eukprot:scaffold12911_cov35-Tisochrysis_lutea.AAC.3
MSTGTGVTRVSVSSVSTTRGDVEQQLTRVAQHGGGGGTLVRSFMCVKASLLAWFNPSLE